MTKLEILNLLDERQNEIDLILAEAKASTLYKIFHLTSQYVNPIVEKRLDNLATIEVEKLYDGVENVGNQDKQSTINS